MMTAPFLMKDTRSAPDSSADYDAWFGENRPGQVDCAMAVQGIKKWLRFQYGQGAIRETPAGTGMVLLQQHLPANFQYHTLPEGIMKLIHSTSFPHRWQDFSEAPGVEYDIRTAFIACCQHVPVYDSREAIFDDGSEFLNFTPACYEVAIKVPDTWQHIGLVPKRPPEGNQHWLYPNKAGEYWVNWLDSSEVALLREHKWPHTIRHRMIFSEKPQPMRNWIAPIIKLLETIERHPRWGDEDIRLIRAGIRAIALQTFGRFHTQGDQERATITPDGHFSVTQSPSLNAYTARFHHPEWSASIWSHARVRITKAALRFPSEQILAIHGDAIRFKNDPNITDTGKVGALRKKAHV